MDKQKMLELAGMLVLAGVTKNEKEIDEISQRLAAELRQPTSKNGGEAYAPPPLEQDKTGFLKFTNQEIFKMPTYFKKTFRANGCIVHVRRRKRSGNGYDYEARYRRDGYNISVSSKNFEDLSTKFIAAVNELQQKQTEYNVPTTFHDFSMYYFEHFRKRKVSASTIRNDMYRYKLHLYPLFGNIPIKK